MSGARRRVESKIPSLASLGVGIAGGLLIWLVTSSYGIGLSPDSVGYIATARRIAAGQGVISYDGRPFVAYPPLYPVVLAAISRLSGQDPLTLARGLNALSLVIVVWISGLLLRRYVSPLLTIAGDVAVLLGVPVVYVMLMAWSEPLFIVWLLLFFLVLTSGLEDGRYRMALLVLVVALATLTRYVGVLLVLLGAATVFWVRVRRGRGIKQGLTTATLFALASSLPLGGWLIRNYYVSGTIFGPRAPSGIPLGQSLATALTTILSWYLPTPGTIVRYSRLLPVHVPSLLVHGYRIVYPLLLGGLLMAVGWGLRWVFVRDREQASTDDHVFLSHLLASFVFLYVAFLVLSATRVAYDQLGHRLLSPVYIPLTLLLFFALQSSGFRHVVSTRYRGLMRVAVVSFLFVWLLYLVGTAALMFRRAAVEGLGYNSRSWQSGEIVRYLQHHELHCPIYTNDPNALYILTGQVGKLSPRKRFYNSPVTASELLTLRGTWPPDGSACLVWFNARRWNYLFNVEELQAIADVRLRASFEDGAIYEIRRKSTVSQ